jgi:DNA-binding NarL/FixJ family response regulator
VRLFGAASALRETSGFVIQAAMEERRRAMEYVRTCLTSEEIEEQLLAGRALSLDGAIAYALIPSAPQPEPTTGPATGLSPREIEVLRFLVDGRTSQEIAGVLFISPRTVERHVGSILNKLGLDSRTAAAIWAVRNGIV